MANEELSPVEENSGEIEPVDEPGEAKARIAELESQLEAKSREISLKEGRIAELELAVTQSNDSLAKHRESFKQAVASYKVLAVKMNPGVLEELISGDSIEAVDASLRSAQELISRVKKNIAEEVASVRVPAGAPLRTTPDLSGLSPREKIQHGLENK